MYSELAWWDIEKANGLIDETKRRACAPPLIGPFADGLPILFWRRF